MPTIGQVYNPLVKAALDNDHEGFTLLQQVGHAIFETNPERCPSVEDGIQAARCNLTRYCQYFGESVEQQVRRFYELDGAV